MIYVLYINLEFKTDSQDVFMWENRKVAFIICSNNDLYYRECIRYIDDLKIPKGYETDIICITGADSIAEAYNAAMESSDARYKVYLHQDVFIYNKNFIQDMITIFQSDKQLGMLGMIGGVNLPQNAVIWNAWNRGATYACNNKCAFPLICIQNPERKWTEVEAVDGMMMITQYDIRWRDDLELGWDFYDISQSLEFRRKGYKVGVAFQEKPWCMHDCGISKLINYDVSRKKILREYEEFFHDKFVPLCNMEVFCLQEKISQELKKNIEQKNFRQALQIKAMIGKTKIESNPLQYALNLVEIYEEEMKANLQSIGFFNDVNIWEEIREKYDTVKFMIRRMNQDMESQEAKELLNLIKNGVVSAIAVSCIARHSI